MWQKFNLNNAYPINAVIQVLLNAIAPGITHLGTVDYSQFLYGTNPITNTVSRLCITPKSNVLVTNATEPAQKATITLKMVLDMLRDCFRLYWFVDSQKRFRIEHISYFMRGGSYTTPANVGVDLTAMMVRRNNKPWAYGQSKYKFDKYSMPERYQFAWMDDVTQFFEGYPLDVTSNYVEKGRIENITIQNFTSDVDYMMLNPGGCSKDGFALLAATAQPMDVDLTGGDAIVLDSYSGNKVMASFDPAAFANAGCEVTLSCDNVSQAMTVRVKFFNGVSVVFTQNVSIPVGGPQTETFNTPAGIDSLEIEWYSGGSGRIGVTAIEPLNPVMGDFGLPFVQHWVDQNVMRAQNGYVAFASLQDFYLYDMPAPNVSRNGTALTVHGTKRLKKNTVNFPCIADPNLYELIKTNVGNGQIEKLTVNLSSRNGEAELAYDTE